MNQSTVHPEPQGFLRRWNIYFAERFPPLQYGVLIAAFTFGILEYTANLGSPSLEPSWPGFLVAFATAFLIILQLRILDEFKDFAEDAQWRPYRPVPRGLVSLSGLRNLWLIAAAIEVAASFLLAPRLLWGLFAIWLYSGLMGVEFFVRTWLKAHPLVYMLSHIVIVPMLAAFVAACHWLPENREPPDLTWLLAASYFAFCVIEVGRKIRAPTDERQGVETYSFLWGLRKAIATWLMFMLMGNLMAVYAASRVQAAGLVGIALGLMFAFALLLSIVFLHTPRPGGGKAFNTLTGLWTLTLFLSLGLGGMV